MNFNWKEDLIKAFILVGIATIIFSLWHFIALWNDNIADIFFGFLLTYCIYHIIYKIKDN